MHRPASPNQTAHDRIVLPLAWCERVFGDRLAAPGEREVVLEVGGGVHVVLRGEAGRIQTLRVQLAPGDVVVAAAVEVGELLVPLRFVNAHTDELDVAGTYRAARLDDRHDADEHHLVLDVASADVPVATVP